MKGLGGMSLGGGAGGSEGVGTTEMPDLDDISDMKEDDLEEGVMRLWLCLRCRLYLLLLGWLMLGILLLALLEIKSG